MANVRPQLVKLLEDVATRVARTRTRNENRAQGQYDVQEMLQSLIDRLDATGAFE